MKLLSTRPRLSAALFACSLLLGTPSSSIEPQEPPNFPLVLQIRAMDGGYGHTCAVTIGGKLICWGDNSSGELGIGTFEQRLLPVEITSVSEPVTTVVTGSAHTCVLTASGRVKCWGSSVQGQLGTGKFAWKTAVPVDVEGLDGPTAVIAAGDSSTCALSSAGGVKCWGSNLFGELGDGTDRDTASARSTPGDVRGLTSDVLAIAVGDYHACALTADKQIMCWGYNANGQLGNGTTTDSSVPVAVVDAPDDIVAIYAGMGYTCGLTDDGAVVCWGANGHLTPYPVDSLSEPVSSLAVGAAHICVVTVSGKAMCWGANSFGQVGDGTTAYRPEPGIVPMLESDVKMVAAGFHHTCAVLDNREVSCWGSNYSGQLGRGVKSTDQKPVSVIGLEGNVSALAAGSAHTCSLMTSGSVLCWGANEGQQTTADSEPPAYWRPQALTGLTGEIKTISSARDTGEMCAQMADDTLQCWWKSPPAPIKELGNDVLAFAIAPSHTCALLKSGVVKCWGDISAVPLPCPNKWCSTPVEVPGIDGSVVAIAAGPDSTCVVLADGRLKCWGSRIGILTPTDVTGIDGKVTAAALGDGHVCALTEAKGVQCWGDNTYGQLGDGTTTGHTTPVSVVGLDHGVSAIFAGGAYSCAVMEEGSVKCWGSNIGGELGNGTGQNRLTPQNVVGVHDALPTMALGDGFACVVTKEQGVTCWGENGSGQLGTDPGWLPGDVQAYQFPVSFLASIHGSKDQPEKP